MKKITILLSALLLLAGCSTNNTTNNPTATPQGESNGISTVTSGKLTVGMECNYAPFNWTQLEKNDTAVPITSVDYCDGYDVAMARSIADQLNLELVIRKTEWEGLDPALNNNVIDAIIAGMTDTPERRESMDFTKPYYSSEMVMIVRKDSNFVNATSIQDFSGSTVLGQLNTNYDSVIDQIKDVKHATPMKTYPLMVVALQSKEVDGLTAELPVAEGVVSANPDLTIVKFAQGQGFEIDTTVSIAVKKGNTELQNALQGALDTITEEQRITMMQDANNRQPAMGE